MNHLLLSLIPVTNLSPQAASSSIRAENRPLHVSRPCSLLSHRPFVITLLVVLAIGRNHDYLECFQRQLLELEQTLEEGCFTNSRTISTGVPRTVVPNVFYQLNLKMMKFLASSCQFVKCIVP